MNINIDTDHDTIEIVKITAMVTDNRTDEQEEKTFYRFNPHNIESILSNIKYGLEKYGYSINSFAAKINTEAPESHMTKKINVKELFEEPGK